MATARLGSYAHGGHWAAVSGVDESDGRLLASLRRAQRCAADTTHWSRVAIRVLGGRTLRRGVSRPTRGFVVCIAGGRKDSRGGRGESIFM